MRDNIKATRWGFLAGLIDGDGGISLASCTSGYQIKVNAGTTSRTTANWLVQQFGGQYSRRKDPRDPNWKEEFRWVVTDSHAKRIVYGIEPYLVMRRDTAKAVIDYSTKIGFREENPELRTKYAEQISDLNHYFVPVQERVWTPLIQKPSAVSKELLAYTAGMIDADGTFSLPTNRSRSPQIQVSNTDQRVLDWLYQQYGGIVFAGNREDENRRPYGLWRFSGGRTQKPEHKESVAKSKELFLLAVLPYLVTKREHAIVSLCALRGDKTTQDCFDRLKELNKVGTPTTNTPSTSEEVKIEPALHSDMQRDPEVIQESI